MKIRADWIQHLHNHRKRELGLIFSKCPERLFHKALELGAGDGFQSGLLTRYASEIICTDLNPGILKGEKAGSIEYRICNAEEIDKVFDTGTFDLIFSSNLLEHLPNPGRALEGIYNVLKDNGITIHIMPNPFWKLCSLLFRFPYMYILFLERIMQGNREMVKFKTNSGIERPFICRLLIPSPHGASESNLREFYLFSKSRWKRQFERANLELINIIKGPIVSGYGFGLNRSRSVLERIGFTSGYIYVAVKKGRKSCYGEYFEKI